MKNNGLKKPIIISIISGASVFAVIMLVFFLTWRPASGAVSVQQTAAGDPYVSTDGIAASDNTASQDPLTGGTSGSLTSYTSITSDSQTALAPQGSAGFLEGRNVIVTIYMNGAFSAQERQMAEDRMDIAAAFLAREGAEYGKSVELIYECTGPSDLNYEMSVSSQPPRNENDENAGYALLDETESFIATNIDTQALLKEYGADGIGFVVFMDADGVSYTFPYYTDTSEEYFPEICFLYKTCDREWEGPATYAHEMLHLFGARDLYETNEYDGVTADMVRYVEDNYPDEIMLYTYEPDGSVNQTAITQNIHDITAYYIGWMDSVAENAAFPSLVSEYTASFSECPVSGGDYSDYEAGYGGFCADGSCFSSGYYNDDGYFSDYYDDGYYDDGYYDDSYYDDGYFDGGYYDDYGGYDDDWYGYADDWYDDCSGCYDYYDCSSYDDYYDCYRSITNRAGGSRGWIYGGR